MSRKLKSCENCGNFRAYYEKCVDTFVKTNKGKCRVFKEIINGQGVCENWIPKSDSRQFTKENIVKSLNRISEDIMGIRKIMQEHKEEKTVLDCIELEL